MPRETTPKPPPGGPKPYAQPISLSKAQMEQITRAVVAALTTVNDPHDPHQQTTHSEDEDANDETPDDAHPETLSSSSSTESLNATLAPLQEQLQNSSDMLRKLHDFLTQFVSTNNHRGIVRCGELIVRHEAIVKDTEARLSSAKEAWETEQRNRKAQLEAAKAKKAAKSKGKAPALLTEDEELSALSAMMGMVPEGDSLPLRAPAPPNPNPELAMLENLLASPSRSPPAESHAPTDLSFRFPRDRPLPQGFSLSRNEGPSTMPTAGPSHLESPSNPFSAIPLHIPTDFSPSKVKGAKAPSPPIAAHTSKKKGGSGTAKAKTGTRASKRAKTHASYADAEDTADEL